jgi:hypothetical protein
MAFFRDIILLRYDTVLIDNLLFDNPGNVNSEFLSERSVTG